MRHPASLLELQEKREAIMQDTQDKPETEPHPWLVMDLLAYHLHRLGGASVESVTFLADGAPWIWDRLSWVCRRVELQAHQMVRTM